MKRLKRHPESRSPLLKVMMWLAVLVVLLGVAIILIAFFTDVCSIDRVDVTGNRYLGADYIRHLSGVDASRNLLTVPVGRLQKNLEEDTWIAKARIGRKLLHEVSIEVSERKPIALINCNGAGFLVDGNGYVIGMEPEEKFLSLPHVHGGETSVPKVGGMVANGRIKESVKVLKGMSVNLRDKLALVNPFDGRGQVFITRMGFQVVYGSDSEGRKKNDMLEAIILDIQKNGRKVAYVDLRVPDSPVVKPG